MPRKPAQSAAAGEFLRPAAQGMPRPRATVGAVAYCLAAAGCAPGSVRRPAGPPFAGLPPAEPLAMAGDWSGLCLAVLAGLLLGLLLAWLWRANRLRQALARPRGLLLPAEVGSLRAALALIEDLVLVWQERDRRAGRTGAGRKKAPAGEEPAGAAVGGEGEGPPRSPTGP